MLVDVPFAAEEARNLIRAINSAKAALHDAPTTTLTPDIPASLDTSALSALKDWLRALDGVERKLEPSDSDWYASLREELLHGERRKLEDVGRRCCGVPGHAHRRRHRVGRASRDRKSHARRCPPGTLSPRRALFGSRTPANIVRLQASCGQGVRVGSNQKCTSAVHPSAPLKRSSEPAWRAKRSDFWMRLGPCGSHGANGLVRVSSERSFRLERTCCVHCSQSRTRRESLCRMRTLRLEHI